MTTAEADSSEYDEDDEFVENEPYLGMAWAVAMLVLYLLKEAFPAEQYSAFWWFRWYVIGIVFAVTVFTWVKRRQFYLENQEEHRKKAEEHSD